MVESKPLRLFHLLAATFVLYGSIAWAGNGVISRVPDPTGRFCHLRFPAISEDTLFSAEPKLKDPSEGDIIDAYGPCNFDPLSQESIRQQQRNYRLRMSRK
jgi:hypothetical protein